MNLYEITYLENSIEKTREVDGFSKEAAIKSFLMLVKNIKKEDILNVDEKEFVEPEKSIIPLDDILSNEVTVVDVKIPFISMVVLLIKLALASIPAAILVGAIWSLIIGAIGNNF
jgi:hypothetical protein